MKNRKLVKVLKTFFLVVISLTFCLMKTSLEMRVGRADWDLLESCNTELRINILNYFFQLLI